MNFLSDQLIDGSKICIMDVMLPIHWRTGAVNSCSA